MSCDNCKGNVALQASGLCRSCEECLISTIKGTDEVKNDG